MKNYFVILCLLVLQNSFSQTTSFNFQKTYTVKEIKEDIEQTEKYLIKFHPDPFKYISKDSLHAFVEQTKARIDSPLTEMQIRFYIKQIIAKIGCGHTDAMASAKYTKAVKTTSRPTLPINTFIANDNRLYVLNNLSIDSTIAVGDEITHIDNKPVSDILKTIYSIYTTDGYNETHKKQGIKYDWFKYYYSFCYGFKNNYQIKTRNSLGIITNHQLGCGSSLKDTLILPKKDSIKYERKIKTCKYYIEPTSPQLAIIDIDAFKGLGWRRFFRKTFKDIKRKNINNIVIDLRDNGGGQIGDGLNMLSYMLHKPTVLSFDRKVNLMAFNPKFKMNVFARLTPIAFCTVMPQFIKNGRLRHYFFILPKYRFAYKGNIMVLTNGKSFSMSGVVASYLKYKANATVIGEETGGNVSGSNAVINGKVVLPHSKIRLLIPFYHIYHDIEVENNGHGITPDYPTQYNKQDILKGIDVDLKKAKELLK